MARKRMIDPSIWQSEDFGKLSILAKVVFIGLFSLADDEGRGRANPMYLKSTLFPYNEKMRSTDVEVALSEISRNMSILFYSYNESNYYSLLSWNTFQKIDKPTESKIPAFEKNNQEFRLLFDEGSTKTSRGVPPKRKEDNIKEKEEKRKEVVEVYNSICTNLSKIQKITDKRKKTIDAFIKEFTIDQFKEICEKANTTDFLIGKNDRGWKADFDFLMRIDKATAILEEKYNTSSKKPKKENFEQRTYGDLSYLYANKGE